MQTNTSRNQLISEHADIARRIALKIARRCPAWMAREDLVAAGMRGLTEAADRYDETRADAFLPFAEHRIRGAVLDELRRGDLLPRRVRTMARKVGAVVRELEATGGEPTEEQIAERLGVTVEHYRDRLAPLAQVQVQPLEGIASVLVSDTTTAPDTVASQREQIGRLRDALSQLEARDTQIIVYHFENDLSYQEIATLLGITGSRVCQLLARALDRLRAKLGVEARTARAAA